MRASNSVAVFRACMLLALATLAPALRVVVVGGGGFVGSRVCRELVTAGCSKVVAVSRSGQPPAWTADEAWMQRVEWVAADAMDAGALEAALEG
eukprot:CAMPEP_0119529530 /NCGR_PEP_ID=MMETSP1344-20130328/43531_1 /TAXON_ID=236787 /ORGANISM="Florenciella parvula, Strain CCMP2471" /LENGTH=93 /DNA_ID=CAMNT_0007569191 /DNA_START=187 /DNA_END=464 /DNA_ORIENTATION=-